MTPVNFIRTFRLLFLWRAYYFFLDKDSYEADGIFMRHGLRVHFGEGFIDKGGYCIRTCWVPAWKAREFEECMGELAVEFMQDGSNDYVAKCDELAWLFVR